MRLVVEPTTYKEPLASLDADSRQTGILKEYQSIQEPGTRTLHDISDFPARRQPVTSKWEFKVKHNADGSVERYKVRIVAKHYFQIKALNYDKTFAPVMRYASLRLIIALATYLELYTDQLDINSAFLNEDLLEKIRMVRPPGIGLDAIILRLNKALYGLKQAPLAWFKKLSDGLAEIGFISLPLEVCVLLSSDYKIIIGVHVDDITTAESR